MRGGERCLEVLCEMFPDADIYTGFYQKDNITDCINSHTVRVSNLGALPGVKRYYRYLLPLYPLAAASLSRAIRRKHEKDPYDLVISISHCLAKNVITPEGSLHVSYCLTPMRYIWDQFDSYFKGRRIEPLVRRFLPSLRRWDTVGAKGVSHFIGISNFVAKRIERVYGRSAAVVYPPVRSDWVPCRKEQETAKGFLCVSALVPYKNVDLIVEAFNRNGEQLTIVGSGPEDLRLKRMAKGNICFLEGLSDEQLGELYRTSRALVFAAEEDFGMTPVEMQASGGPVICFGKGGALETVDGHGDNPSGMYFSEATAESLMATIEDFKTREREFKIAACCEKAESFSAEHFKAEFSRLLINEYLPSADFSGTGVAQFQSERTTGSGSGSIQITAAVKNA
jgi:glycosyltransferase involved in cell wall biosynthesis